MGQGTLSAYRNCTVLTQIQWFPGGVGVVNPVTIVAIGHELLQKFWRLVIGGVLRTAGSSFILNYADPRTSLELLNYYLTLAMSSI